jgi:hypothetical protein
MSWRLSSDARTSSGEAVKLFQHQDELLRSMRDEVRGKDTLRKKIEAGNLRLFLVKDLISHEKLFLLEGERGRTVLTGSANFSENVFSGKQNEGRRPVEVQELLVAHPLSARHDLVAHHRHVRCLTPEGDEAELREQQEKHP